MKDKKFGNAFKILQCLLPICSKNLSADEIANLTNISPGDVRSALNLLKSMDLVLASEDYDGGHDRYMTPNLSNDPYSRIQNAANLVTHKKEHDVMVEKLWSPKRKVLRGLKALFNADDGDVSNMHFFLYFFPNGKTKQIIKTALDAALNTNTNFDSGSTELWIGTRYNRTAEDDLKRFVRDLRWTSSSASNCAFNPGDDEVIDVVDLPNEAFACYEIEHDHAFLFESERE